MDLIIRAEASFRRLAGRSKARVFAMALSPPVILAGAASYNQRVVVGDYFLPDNYRITEDGEVRITEDGDARIVDG